MPRLNLAGRRFGRLVVEAHVGTRPNGRIVWRCKCDCGQTKDTTACNLTTGHVASCGCLQRESRIKHGHGSRTNRSREYHTWQGLVSRCTDPNSAVWKHYGGRGITVCSRWRSFENFFADMGPKPSPRHTIDRIDNERGYEPGNCRWATKFEQAINTRRTRLTADKVAELRRLHADGMTYRELAARYGITKAHARNVGAGLQWKSTADECDVKRAADEADAKGKP